MVARRYVYVCPQCRVTFSSYNHDEAQSLYEIHLGSHGPAAETVFTPPAKPRRTKQLKEDS